MGNPRCNSAMAAAAAFTELGNSGRLFAQAGSPRYCVFFVLFRLCRLGIAAAGRGGSMNDAVAEVAMTGADTVASELVQQLHTFELRALVSAKTLFGQSFELRDSAHPVVHVGRLIRHAGDLTIYRCIYHPAQFGLAKLCIPSRRRPSDRV